MKEQLISFETAKLAKEKGFDIKTDNWYRLTMSGLYGRGAKRGGLIPPITQGIAIALAPTQSILQKWLREKHNIYIDIASDLEDGVLEIHVDLFTVDRKNINWGYAGLDYTYEKALEKGLFEALKLIK